MRLNSPIYLNTLRWFLDSPARLVLAVLVALATYGVLGGLSHLEINGVSQSLLFNTPAALAGGGNKVLVLLAWVLGMGVIRREVSSGAIQLVLLRPLTRATYVLSKWAALATLNLAFLVFVYAVVLARGGAGLLDATLAGLFAAQVVQVLALCAVLTLLSCVPFDLGELGVAVLAMVALGVLGHYAGKLDATWPDTLVAQAWKALFPQVEVDGGGMLAALQGGGGTVQAVSSIVFNAGVTAAALAGGMALLARREFTYAEAGG